jgi:hypothetical protein
MAKYYGKIGFAVTEEIPAGSGIWKERITELPYYGDLTRNTRKLESAGNLNDNVNLANNISIVSDPFAQQNFHSIRYAEYLGTKWKVSNVEVQYPRLILTIGGVYNETTIAASQ